MMIGFLLPLLRGLGARTRVLVGLAVTAVGVALAVVMVLQRHGHSGSVSLIRIGALLTLAGLVLTASSVRGALQSRGRGRSG